MDDCLIIGNGINRCCGGMSWKDLLSRIASSYFVSKDTVDSSTLAFEQLRGTVLSRNINVQRSDFALSILEQLNELNQPEFNSIFNHFKLLSIKNILTTNFDYAIERAFVNDFDYKNYTRNVVMPQETRCSRIRHTKIDNETNIFHIHGELGKHSTICLGYAHYASNLNAIMSNLLNYDKSTDTDSLKNEVFNDELLSWAQFFFTKNIYIVGLGLYDCDMDLWWPIVYRHQLITSSDPRIKNKITYYYLYEERKQSFKDCLESMGIEVKELQVADQKWDDAYISVAEDIEKHRGNNR